MPPNNNVPHDAASNHGETMCAQHALANCRSTTDVILTTSLKRKEDLAKELDEESNITLSDDDHEVKDSEFRKLSLSPTQFFDSKVTGALRGNVQGNWEQWKGLLLLLPLCRS